MKISLKPMNDESFSKYQNIMIPAYANENVQSGRWDKSGALERSKNECFNLLPEGLKSKNNYLFDVIENTSGDHAGYIWVKVEDQASSKSAFIYDVGIYENYRRKGYAKSALHLIEKVVAEQGVTSIGLHVFNQNTGAQYLYNSIGYQMVSHNMRKIIKP
ncbi:MULTISPECIES: GNAT family N-acetyltransferase [unclassified Agarivorans]|uniref:GNAT family N-acetyltransferase n=1 Tax=unclassified Agarivorans TaxID=2636026 RepID=UPI003D7D1639